MEKEQVKSLFTVGFLLGFGFFKQREYNSITVLVLAVSLLLSSTSTLNIGVTNFSPRLPWRCQSHFRYGFECPMLGGRELS